MWTLKNRINEQTKLKRTDRTDRCCHREGFGGLAERGEGIKKSNWWLRNSHGAAGYSIRNEVRSVAAAV